MSETTHQSTPRSAYMAERQGQGEITGWVGWIGFGALLMILQGIFQSIAGLVGIFQSAFFVVSDSSSQLLVFSDIQTWGWVNLLIGLIVFFAGLSLFSGSMWARTVAVIVAMGAAITNLLAISLYPIWSIIGIVLSVLIMYAVLVHGKELKELQDS